MSYQHDWFFSFPFAHFNWFQIFWFGLPKCRILKNKSGEKDEGLQKKSERDFERNLIVLNIYLFPNQIKNKTRQAPAWALLPSAGRNMIYTLQPLRVSVAESGCVCADPPRNRLTWHQSKERGGVWSCDLADPGLFEPFNSVFTVKGNSHYSFILTYCKSGRRPVFRHGNGLNTSPLTPPPP